ncbi:MAG: hypothetical protein QM734_01990 [Cyclobacteriaceae bacterium]
MSSGLSAQNDTLKFIDGTYYVLSEGGRLLFPSLKRTIQGREFIVAESQAEFPGGLKNLYEWLSKNIKPDSSLKVDIHLKAIFTITENGLPSSVIVQGDTASGRGKEVVKLISAMPRWKPGLQYDKTVKTRMALPITFPKSETLAITKRKKKRIDKK